MTVETSLPLAAMYRFLADVRRPLLIVLGPSASGKTAFSIQLALELSERGKRAEIVNADSRQLYRFLDIGTAKICQSERRGVPHHLLGVLDPKEEVTIAWYKREAERAIREISDRENVPILVGGSMLYISAVIDGLEPLPKAESALRRSLEEEYDKDSGEALYRRLVAIDSEAASAFHRNNKPYVIRAMEIYETTGERVGGQKTKSCVPYDLLIFGMLWPRGELVSRINRRTHELFERGWIAEVEELLKRGYLVEDPGMKSHGYREIMGFLEGRGPETQAALQAMIAAKTRQYAKRQMTWWRHDPRIAWIDCSSRSGDSRTSATVFP